MSSTDDAELLARKVRDLTVAPIGPIATPEVVIVVHRDGDVGDGFARARELLAANKTVRLIGIGLTIPRSWPPWVEATQGLALTELGALQWAPLAAVTGPMQAEMRAWIRAVSGRSFGASAPDRLLFAGACARFLQPYIVQFMTARPLAMLFPAAAVEHIGGGDGVAPASRGGGGSLRSRARIVAWGAAALAGSVVEVCKAYASARHSFEEIERRRRTSVAGRKTPTTWVGLVPDWYRINHHLLEALALPELEQESGVKRASEDDSPLGVLLISSIHPGRRDESDMRRWHESDGAWPGLGGLCARLDRCVVEQAVMPRSRIAFAKAVAAGVRRAGRTLAGIAAHPAPSFGCSRVDIAHHAQAVTTWATLDVLRATLAEAAAAEIARRIDLSGADVVFVAANSPAVTGVDLTFQRVGARTVHHEHGAGGDCFSGVGSTESMVRCLWTTADARSAARAARATLVTGMPVGVRLPPRGRPPRNVLVMTNYVHRDTLTRGKRYPFEPFYAEMVETARLILALDRTVEVRIRPHPADDDATLRRYLEPAMVLSRGVPIATDAAWADIIVTSMSTVFFEVLFAGVPIFVHAEPSIRNLPATDFIDPTRLFLRAEEGAAAVDAWRRAWTPTGNELLPEQRARVALFGPTAEPEPMTSYFGRRALAVQDRRIRTGSR